MITLARTWMLALCLAALAVLGACSSTDPDTAPTITQAPTAQTTNAPEPATFSVAAEGKPGPSYQWQRNGVAIEGATGNSYTTGPTNADDNGAVYTVTVRNALGSVSSTSATLSVVLPPVLGAAPQTTAVIPGAAAVFRAAVQLLGASGGLSFQWQRDGTDIPGATQDTYTLATPTAADDGAEFRVRIRNSAGEVTSPATTLRVQAVVLAPSITAQPQTASVVDGATALLSVEATGTAPFDYQWQRNGVDLPGATAASYTTPALSPADSPLRYSVTVRNSAGSVASETATITVLPAPVVIGRHPASVSANVGQTANFSVVASGTGPIDYQWLLDGTAIAGANGASYSTPTLALANHNSQYSVRASNAVGSVTSNAARLTVSTSPLPVITTAPQAATVINGQAASFSVTALGTAPLSYQWLRNGVAITNARSASHQLIASSADDGASYSVRVSNALGNVTSAGATLTVQPYASPLDSRAWAAGQSLEENTSAVSVSSRTAAIDDAGRVTVLFRKSDGSRIALYAVRGTPGGPGVAPTWSAPVAIDMLAGVALNNLGTTAYYNITAAPGGDMLATWRHAAACNATTYSTSPSAGCWYHYMNRYRLATGAWDGPLLLTDSPIEAFQVLVNDRGDLAMLGNSWVRSGSNSYNLALALFMLSAGEATPRRQLLNGEPITGPWLALDGSGNLLLGAQASQNATTDVVAYRGTMATGLGAAQILDTRSSAASLRWVSAGVGGQQVLLWDQNNGSRSSLYAAVSTGPNTDFSVTDVAASIPGGYLYLTLSDEGQAHVFNTHYGGPTGFRLSWNPRDGWTPSAIALPEGFPRTESGFGQGHFYGMTRDGHVLALKTLNGSTGSYDARRNQMVMALPESGNTGGYLNGFDSYLAPATPPLLSKSGIGFTTLLNNFDVLPTPSAPSGDGRSVTNLWGVFLK